jgi:hypothetical protein
MNARAMLTACPGNARLEQSFGHALSICSKREDHRHVSGEERRSMNTSSGNSNALNPDPSVYRLGPGHFRIMIDAIYDRLGARYGQSVQRIIVSTVLGLIIYAVGLLIGIPIGFATLYASTPAVYIVVLAAAMAVDQVRYLKQAFITRACSPNIVC